MISSNYTVPQYGYARANKFCSRELTNDQFTKRDQKYDKAVKKDSWDNR